MSRYQRSRIKKAGVRAKRVRACGIDRGTTRYGLTVHQVVDAGKRIRANLERSAVETPDMVLIKRQSDSRSKVAVLIDGKWFLVVYNRKHQVIHTFLPRRLLDGRFSAPQQTPAEEQIEAWLNGEIAMPIR